MPAVREALTLWRAAFRVLGNVQYLHPRESGYFEGPYVQRAWRCPSFAFGPGNTAHKPDENVRMDDVRKTGNVFLELIRLAS
jgi:acetylornithine deacetylase/succinyl-diaminopimelate desuccinylase-like protein